MRVIPHFAVIGLLLALVAPDARAALYTVSPAGDDANPGTDAAPWRTLGHAASVAVAGDTVELLTGTYAERVLLTRSGTAEAPITFRARADNQPVIDGSTLATSTGWTPLLWITGAGHITIQGLELTGLNTATRRHVPIGILVTGGAAEVRLLDNHIHHLGTTYPGADGGDAHGIAVYGDDTTPVAGLVIRGNHLHDLTLGSSEALVLNGNVDGFLVENNTVTDCNNIGIDAIGHEGTAPSPELDAARNGVIRGNLVAGISSFGNPAYGDAYAAGGIYVDGGRDILVERNTVRHCDIGIELASEHAGRSTSGIHVRNNLIHHNRIGGIFMGGYDRNRGSTVACLVRHNTLFENDANQYGNGEIHLQFDVRDTDIRDNLIVTNGQNLVLGNPYAENTGNTLDYNLVHTPGTPRWQWKKTNHNGLAAWRSASGQDAATLFADPNLLAPAAGDFGLRPRSPAIDAGDPAFTPASGELDHAGTPRLRNARSDIGALEFDLLTFACGTDRETASLSLVDGEPRLTLRRRTDWAGQALVFTIEHSPDLGPETWTNADSVTTESIVMPAPSDGTERVTFAFPPPSGARWFARVRIQTAP
ncbi:MAG: right-handed parallel beta-helix repeat-containing protein [Verrucomicrobiota bacterium]